MARNAYEPQDRERLLQVARAYDHLAARAFDWKTARRADRPEAVSKRNSRKEI
jgi:hypothetical protein